MKKIIVITGDLASGKSTLAEKLEEKLSYLTLKKDNYKEIICDALGFSNRKENLAFSNLTMDLLFYTVKQAMKDDVSIIFEANFHPLELAKLNDLVKQYRYRAVYINLTGDVSLLYERFLKRLPTRHPAHLSMGLQDDIKRFKEYVCSSRFDMSFVNPYTVDMSKLNEEEVLKKVLFFLKKEGFIDE